MKRENICERFLNFGVGAFYYLKKNFKRIIEEIENEGKEHSKDFEDVKKEISKLSKIPKKIIGNFIKSFGFVTKDEFEKFKEEIKNG